MWEASGLAGQWQAASAAGGSRGAVADADLDAVVALFDAAARFTARLPQGSTLLFADGLSGQEIAGDTLSARSPRDDSVAVLTAHKSKGLEWDLVVVAGVQEGSWPDLRQRGSLLGMDELVDVVAGRGPGPAADAAAAAAGARLLAEERRLFYVAVTRARRFLVVTAVGADDTEERPSRFLAGAGLRRGRDRARHRKSRSPLAVPPGPGQRTCAGPRRTPASLTEVRAAAAGQLARAGRRRGARGASPRHWWPR